MELLFDTAALQERASEILVLVRTYLTSIAFLGQVAAVVAAGFVSILFGRRIQLLIARLLPKGSGAAFSARLIAILNVIAVSGLWFVLAWAALVVAQAQGWDISVLRIAVNLLGAWVLIRAASKVVRNPLISNALFVLVWGGAALNMLGILGPVLTELNKIGIPFGAQTITGLTVLKGLFALALLLWAAGALSQFLSARIRTIEQLTPTLQILFSKIVQFVLIALAIIFALQVVGIPLTAFAIFGGAVGIGVGLGLQKTASNIISGLTLLMDKSIKPGDVLSVGSTFGWVTSLGGRYVAVRTRDGIEHLIPNEVFIAHGVENWSHSDRAVRLKLPVGIDYACDPHKAIAVCIAMARKTPRVLEKPEPICIITAFGESAIELELRFWIADPHNGVGNVKGEVYLEIWDAFAAEGIKIPYRKVDIELTAPVEVSLKAPAA